MRRFKREVLRRGPFIERVWAPSAMPALAAIALVLFFGTGIAVVVASWDFDRGARAVSDAAGSPASDRPATAPSSHGARAAPDRFRLLRAVAASARQQALVREPTVGGRGALPVAARTARVVAGTKAPVTRPPPRRSRPEPDARAAATPTPPAQPATPAPPPPPTATPQ